MKKLIQWVIVGTTVGLIPPVAGMAQVSSTAYNSVESSFPLPLSEYQSRGLAAQISPVPVKLYLEIPNQSRADTLSQINSATQKECLDRQIGELAAAATEVGGMQKLVADARTHGYTISNVGLFDSTTVQDGDRHMRAEIDGAIGNDHLVEVSGALYLDRDGRVQCDYISSSFLLQVFEGGSRAFGNGPARMTVPASSPAVDSAI